MQFSLDERRCSLSVGEFAAFTLGPREAGPVSVGGLWRARLGQQWHAQLRTRTDAEVAALQDAHTRADAAFEVPLSLPCLHRGWHFTLSGRIDQLVTIFALPGTAGPARTPAVRVVLREIKTVAGPLPAEEATLRADYPEYFLQVITYLALLRSAPFGGDDRLSALVSGLPPGTGLAAELVFVELGTGLTQTIVLRAEDEVYFRSQLERLVQFLDLRLGARERLRHLDFQPAFATLRPGQETIQEELRSALAGAGESPTARVIFFEAPTGYGKTGVLLEFALSQLRAGGFSRLVYLTGKSTGQLQVMRTLTTMTSFAGTPGASWAASALLADTAVAAWQVRPKSEHCINSVFHCVRDACPFLADLATRWADRGLARFYLHPAPPHDLPALQAAGREARICPYEITRAALPFNDVWIGDYNYVFAPDSRGVFLERPGFIPAETLLIVDEAHNLPARVADAHSHVARATDAEVALAGLRRIRPPAALLLAWEHWSHLLAGLQRAESLAPDLEAEIRESVEELATLVLGTPLDYAALGPQIAAQLWQPLALRDWITGGFFEASGFASDDEPAPGVIPTLQWCPRAGELHFTCLDASAVIGRTLRGFGAVVLASATLRPADVFAASCGLDAPPRPAIRPATAEPPAALGKLPRKARRTLRGVTSGAALLQVEEARERAHPRLLQANAPWRAAAYRVGIDLRVDTTFQHRVRHYATTAATVVQLQHSAGGPIVVFFPSYAYAESIQELLASTAASLRVALQPRAVDLAAQAEWVETSLVADHALFLVLGSSFAESIDLLGGRVSQAMVVGPALPEVNALQRTRLAELEHSGLSRDDAFRRVYQIPGMTKVNQALGRLVRAPGQQAGVLLHCRRFAEASYAALLAPEYQQGTLLATEADLAAWLQRPASLRSAGA